MRVCEPASRSESAPRGCRSQLDWHSTEAAYRRPLRFDLCQVRFRL